MITFEHFTPTAEHPWTPSVIHLLGRELATQPLKEPDNLPEDLSYYREEGVLIEADYYGLAKGSELLAVGTLSIRSERERVLDYLVVRAEERGKGYGGRLLKELHAVAQAAGATCIRTEPAGKDAKGFFAHYGYQHRPIKGTLTESWLKNLIE